MDDFEILFGGYATPFECEAFWRLALNSYPFLANVIDISISFIHNISVKNSDFYN